MKKWTPDKIYELRDNLNLTQEAFGERIGVTSRYVIYLEQGRRNPSKTMQILLDYISGSATSNKRGDKE
jgi:DNA-binding transcriptional regulator YiaG